MATIASIKDRINQMDQASFQILCDAYLSRIGYQNLVSLGTKAGAQKTTPGTPDTYFCISGGKYIFAEYTTQKDGLVEKIRKDIQKCLDVEFTQVDLSEIIEIVYCHTSSNIKPKDDSELKTICENCGIKLTLIGIDSLAEGLMKYPTIIKDHLGLNIDSEQIQTAEDFIKQYNSNALAATLDTVFISREKELSAIDDAFSKHAIVLLTGPAGTGKTRLALEYAKKHSQENEEHLFCIHDRARPLYDDLILYFEKPDKYFVIIDDANQLSEIGYAIEYANKGMDGYQVKILITVRDYASKKIMQEIASIARYGVVPIGAFTDEEIQTLMKNHYGILNSHYLERITQIAEGNARIAMLAGKIAFDTNRLDSISDVTALYADYYGNALHEVGIDSDSSLLVSAGIMAFLNAIHLDHIDPIQPILAEKKVPTEIFIENLHVLHEHEIVDICNDKGVRFSEQCLANFILKYVFYDKRIIKLSAMIEACFKPYRERTMHAINTLLGVFQNKDLHEYVEREIRALWKKLDEDNSPNFFEYVKAFCPVNQTETLIILKELVDNTPPAEIQAEEICTETGRNYQSVSDEIITVLGYFADTENLETALDLFFQYYLRRPDLYIQFYHASVVHFCIHRDSVARGCCTQIKFFQKMTEYADSWNNPYLSLLFLDVAEQFLQLEFSPHENRRNGKGFVIYRLPLPYTEGVCEYRKIIWEQILALSSKNINSKQILNVLHNYGRSIADCSKAVVRFDAPYICQLAIKTLSPGRLADCLLALSLKRALDASDYQTEELDAFLINQKMKIYQLMKGPRWDTTINYEEHEKQKRQAVVDYLNTVVDMNYAFNEMFDIYSESVEAGRRDQYEIAEGVNAGLKELENAPETFVAAAEKVLMSESIVYIDYLFVVRKLFSLLTPDKVFAMLSHSNNHNKNNWMYAYYHELPSEFVNKKALDGLYAFLRDDSDKLLRSLPCRDVDFLKKFLEVDKNAFINGAKIIHEKRSYSPAIVSSYFSRQFHEDIVHPAEVVEKFKNDIALLEQIYLCLEGEDRNVDYDGKFLYEICLADQAFILIYSEELFSRKQNFAADPSQKLCVFYQDENYTEIFDSIINAAFLKTEIPSMDVPKFIKHILDLPEKFNCFAGKRDEWTKHYIVTNCKDKLKMECLFEAISELSMQWTKKYIEVFCSCNDDFELFKALPLTPMSSSWSGSAVPMYSSWVTHLESLLPLFPGLKFLKHKKLVEERIESLHKKIIQEEISDILEG